MMLHVLALPHTQLTPAYSACAYTSKVRRFIPMMADQGFEVMVHGQLTRDQQARHGFNGPDDYLAIEFDASRPIWIEANSEAIQSVGEWSSPGDVLCVIAGTAQLPVVNAHPQLIPCEFGIGYTGIIPDAFHVYESEAWRNFVSGWHHLDGHYYDEVVPNAYRSGDFEVVSDPDDYYAFVGRLGANKGLDVAQDVCERLGVELRIAGQGTPRGYGEFLGLLPYDEVTKLMAHARALFVPTRYVGPFEGVHVEAQFSGTPVITSDFGVFTETVVDGLNGYRCRMFGEYLEAAELVKELSRPAIAASARQRWSTDVIGPRYAEYFERLSTLSHGGWYQ